MPKIVDWKERQEKAAARNRKFSKNRYEKTKVYTVRVYYDSPLYEATESAAAKAEIQPGTYLRLALVEKLQKDGFLTNAPEDVEEE